MPSEKRSTSDKTYDAVDVVVQYVNHNVTFVLEEKVDDMGEDPCDISIFMVCNLVPKV